MVSLDDPLGRALSLMQHALELIDGTGDASDAGAHLDLAVERLRGHLSVAEQSGARRAPLF